MAWGYWSATAVDRGRSPRRNTQCTVMPINTVPQSEPPAPTCYSPCRSSRCSSPSCQGISLTYLLLNHPPSLLPSAIATPVIWWRHKTWVKITLFVACCATGYWKLVTIRWICEKTVNWLKHQRRSDWTLSSVSANFFKLNAKIANATAKTRHHRTQRYRSNRVRSMVVMGMAGRASWTTNTPDDRQLTD